MTRTAFLLAAVIASGCATRVVRVDPATMPDDFEMMLARWSHDLGLAHVGGERYVVSSISDETAVRYEVTIGVPELGVEYVTTQRAPDGTESETLAVTLRAGDKPDELYAQFDHIVSRRDGVGLSFSGKTVLRR